MTPSPIMPTPVKLTANAVAGASPAPAAASSHSIWSILGRILEVVAVLASAAAAPFESARTQQITETESQLVVGALGALTNQGQTVGQTPTQQ